MKIFKKKQINRNFWSKKRGFWLYLGHFLDFDQEKKMEHGLVSFGTFFVNEVLV